VKPDDVKRLIGGYATGTLTPAEQKALFEAALDDQELFDAIAREQALKEALDDPAIRRELIADLTPAPSWRERLAAWMRPAMPIGALGALAAGTLGVVLYVQNSGPKTTEIAQAPIRQQPQLDTPASALSPPAQPAEKKSPEARPEFTRSKAKSPMPAPMVQSPPAAENRAVPAAPIPAPPSIARMAAPQPAPVVIPAPAPEQFRTSIVASEADTAKKAESVNQRADGVVGGVPGGVVGSIIGGAPGPSAAMAARPKRMVADAAAARSLSVRYQRQKTGELTNLIIEANADSIAYLFRRGEAGEWVAIAPGGMSLKANVPFTTTGFVPGATQPAAVLILSRRPLSQLAQTGSALTSVVQEMLAQPPGEVVVTAVKLP
jgi:hypothetical protein